MALDQPDEAIEALKAGLALQPQAEELKTRLLEAMKRKSEKLPAVQERRRNPTIFLKTREARRPREVRVFLSSTFKDMEGERAYLAKNVFPELEAFCAARNVKFTTVDLRWGITAADSQNGKVLSLCLSQVDLCRPYFVSFVGDRYGWSQVPGRKDELLRQTFETAMREHPWLEKYQDRSITEIEILYGALLQDRNVSKVFPDPTHCFLYIRDSDVSRRGGPDFVESNAEIVKKMEDLKLRLRESYCLVKDYGEPEQLGQSLLEQLRTAINDDFPKDNMPPAERENTAHLMYAEALLGVHLPRQAHLKQLEAFFNGPSSLAVVSGPPGIGKGHFAASWFLDHHTFHPKMCRVLHFVQGGARGNPLSVLLTRLMSSLKKHFGWALPIPDNLEQLLVEFPAWLQRTGSVAGPRGRICLVVDGIDQCDDPAAQELRWLPKLLPKSIKVILTSRPGALADRLLKRGASEVKLEPFSLDEIDSFATDHLANYGKRLSPAQKNQLLGSDSPINNPLFLRTLLDQIRTYATFETLGAELTRYLSAKTHEALYGLIFKAWQSEAGAKLVSDVLSLLWCAKYGLEERELTALLNLDRQQQFQFLWLNLSPHLVSRGGVFRFSNPYLASAVEQSFINGEAGKRAIAAQMVAYFEALPICRRKAHELPHLLLMAGQSEGKLAAFLSHPEIFSFLAGPDERADLLRYWAVANKTTAPRQIVVLMQAGLKTYLSETHPLLDLSGAIPRGQLSASAVKLLHQIAEFFSDLGQYTAAKDIFQQLISPTGTKQDKPSAKDLLGLARAEIELGRFAGDLALTHRGCNGGC